jgi:signal transduction histidine kinase
LGRIEKFSEREGLSNDVLQTMLEDREGNIWIATNNGLNRFTPSSVRSARQAGYQNFALLAANDGAVWWAKTGRDDSNLLCVFRDGVIEEHAVEPSLVVPYRDDDGSFLFGAYRGLWRVEGKELRPVPAPPALADYEPQALVRDRSGALWVSIVRYGVVRETGSDWVLNGGFSALPNDTAVVMTKDERGRLWFGYTNARLAMIDGDEVRIFGPADGLDIGNITSISVRGDRIWIGGARGLLLFDGQRFHPVQAANGDPFRSLSGLVETAAGELWAAGSTGILRIERPVLTQFLDDRTTRLEVELFDARDGLPSTAQQLRPTPSMIEARDGRLWFALVNDVVSIDPKKIVRNKLPPPVTIWSVQADGQSLQVFRPSISLPVGMSRLQIAYTAGSLTMSERVRFRYRLEGFDGDWQDAGASREASYTNLPPGSYRFHVIAANKDGVWNEAGASLTLTIPPFFYQTLWFRALCAILVALSLLVFFRIRLQQARAAVRARLEERIIERERIARELHDTLLQGLQGLILRFQAVSNRVAETEPVREQLNQVLTRADEVLIESRDRVKDLRTNDTQAVDLAAFFAAFGQALVEGHPTEFRMTVEGTPAALHPILREEICMIGREALTNAFHHAAASSIELDLTFGRDQFRLRVRDDGKGIDAEMLKSGKTGHWGLAGMRERARKVRAQFDIWSHAGAGTEIELSVPAALIYQHRSQRGMWRWLRLRAAEPAG